MIILEEGNQALLREHIRELEQSFKSNVMEPLAALQVNRESIRMNLQLYYNAKKDTKDIERYYKSVKNTNQSSKQLFLNYHQLIKRTHSTQYPYYISKDQYLYTWVDLHPDGSVKSIYSGEFRDPRNMIQEDFETIKKKHSEFQYLLHHENQMELIAEKMIKIDSMFKYNTEHIVPQSWYSSREPMKGDLHHLFVCQPDCNTSRSNFPYEDFSFYVPESPYERIQNRCGVAANGRFEPEHGKGAVARAMMYFLLRYPKAIKKSFLKKIDMKLLVQWHQRFPVTLYEKHRNQSIFRIQGNRNPFIDFPDLADVIQLPFDRLR